MKATVTLLVVQSLLLLGGCRGIGTVNLPGPGEAVDEDPLLAVANDNRSPAGAMRDGVLELKLEAKLVSWRPGEETHEILAFAEEGGSGSIPGPLLRIPQGTEVRISVRNSIPEDYFIGLPPPRYQTDGVRSVADAELVVYGLRAGTDKEDTLRVPFGEVREVRYRADVPGTFFYRGTASERSMRAWTGRDSQLAGAIIVDPVDVAADPDERIFVITMTDAFPDQSRDFAGEDLFEPVINGLSWPRTERLHYRVGDTVRWRWINASGFIHPMHLHGAHFRTLAKGDGVSETFIPANKISHVVTELMEPGATFRMEWIAPREGNWLMHCHFVDHVIPDSVPDAAMDEHGAHDPSDHAFKAMAGLVLGITVSERDDPDFTSVAPRKEFRLVAREAVTSGTRLIRGFSLQEGGEPVESTMSVPGPPLILTRGEKASIAVVNEISEPTTVHWHGMELESVYDGVPGWSRTGSKVAPLLATGETFVVEMTPPRSGTYMYHSHMDATDQLLSGMYGPLIVLEPGEVFNTELDRIFTFGGTVDSWIALNGERNPTPITLSADAEHRLRFINIHREATINLRLVDDSGPVTWRRLAKDGADLPLALRRETIAELRIGVGETYDFNWIPETPGEVRLEVQIPFPTEAGESRFHQVWRIHRATPE